VLPAPARGIILAPFRLGLADVAVFLARGEALREFVHGGVSNPGTCSDNCRTGSFEAGSDFPNRSAECRPTRLVRYALSVAANAAATRKGELVSNATAWRGPLCTIHRGQSTTLGPTLANDVRCIGEKHAPVLKRPRVLANKPRTDGSPSVQGGSIATLISSFDRPALLFVAISAGYFSSGAKPASLVRWR